MNSSNRGNPLILAALCLGMTLGSASAQTSEEGVQLYKSGKYGPALAIFEAIAKKQPTNAMTHYYIALCAHGMNQTARAAQEYQWVSTHSSGALKKAAESGLDSVTRYSSGRSAQVAASAANEEAKKAAAAEKADGKRIGSAEGGGEAKRAAAGASVASTAAKAKAGAAAPVKGAFKCAKVIEFNTTWDRESLAFEPVFESAKSKYTGKVAFQVLDAESEANAALRTKYNVSANYPTLVYLDSNGAVLKTSAGRPDSVEAFSAEIESFK